MNAPIFALDTLERRRAASRDAEVALYETSGTLLFFAALCAAACLAQLVLSVATDSRVHPIIGVSLAAVAVAYGAVALALRAFDPRARLAALLAVLPLFAMPIVGHWFAARVICFLVSPGAKELFSPEHAALRAQTPKMNLRGLHAGQMRVVMMFVAMGIALSQVR